ncbi:hypothetical protein C3L33_01392, partial [Rhododendron williamsianum]
VSLEHCDEKRKQTTTPWKSEFKVAIKPLIAKQQLAEIFSESSLVRIFAYPTQEAPFFHQRRSAPTWLRVSASYSNPSGDQVEYTPWLIVGLGNPGSKYHGTRHNVRSEKYQFCWQKPQAYMNFTGESVGSQLSLLVLVQQENVLHNQSTGCRIADVVGPLAAYYQVPLRHILLVYDEMSLPNSILRLQPKGGHGYLNGVMPAWIGNPPGTMDMKAYLLQKCSLLEQKQMDAALEQGVDAVRNLVLKGFNSLTTRFNLEQKYKYNKV